jgi:hypothetical protein
MEKLAIVFVMFAAVSIFAGCSGDEYTSAPSENAPDYEIANEFPGPTTADAPQFTVDTEAETEEDFRLIAQEIRSENADLDGLFVNFYSPAQGQDGAGATQTGAAVAANSEETSREILRPDVLSGYAIGEARNVTPEQIMEQQNGMLVVSIEDELDVMTVRDLYRKSA